MSIVAREVISEEALGALEAGYPLGAWGPLQPMPLGKNQHWRFETPAGRFVLRRSYRAKTVEGVRFEHELVAHLRAGGFPAPVYVPTAAGAPCAEIEGRLWRVAELVSGRPARIADTVDSAAFGAALARYHRTVEGFRASVPTPAGELIPEALRARLDEVGALTAGGAGVPEAMGAGFAATRQRAEAVCDRLEELYPALSRTLVHAGCRRGSVIFDENGEIAVVLDFDSAHTECRALDLAVGVFDFAKLYGEPGSAEYKVHLDPASATAFLDGYQSVTPLDAGELEAAPLLVLAKRLKRALGRYSRLLSGGEMSAGDWAKIGLEEARVRSLEGSPLVSAGLTATR